ncbi:cell wall-binding repeat-containing protein [Streptomyces sp. NPDC012888]|uniref:cell wall-binding repeat-containing protein n=1 Tax=Streptomyces sp. NPDC012888 TaxID=3364855 RepID=UPI0036C4D48A
MGFLGVALNGGTKAFARGIVIGGLLAGQLVAASVATATPVLDPIPGKQMQDAATSGSEAALQRLQGSDAVGTSIETSRAHWKGVSESSGFAAQSVVIARVDAYYDGIAAIPLAKAKKAPLLLTGTGALDVRVATEIKRILPAGKTIYIVGGTIAVSAATEQSLKGLGYQVVRFSGADASATALSIAKNVPSPKHVTIATHTSWYDAVTASTAAAVTGGAFVYSTDKTISPAVKAWLDALPAGVTKTTVGGPARESYASTHGALVGQDAFETAALTAEKFTPQPVRVGVATSKGFYDAMSGGAFAATVGMPLLLNPPETINFATNWSAEDHSATTKSVTIFGGKLALSEKVGEQAQDAATEKFISGEIVPAGEKQTVTHEQLAKIAIQPDWVESGAPTSFVYNGRMNDAEWEFCAWPSRWNICENASMAALNAREVSDREKQPGGIWPGSNSNGGKVDAYRHCSWNAYMAWQMGSKTAKGFADRHEMGPKPPNMSDELANRHHAMDYHNNALGRFFGQHARDQGLTGPEATKSFNTWCKIDLVPGGALQHLWY